MPFPSADPRVDRLLREIFASRVYDIARETPLDTAARLSARVGAQVLLKREDLQPVFSFKLRGAYNKIAPLTPDQRASTSSARAQATMVRVSPTRRGRLVHTRSS